MKIKDRIEELLNQYNNDQFRALWSKCKEIIESVIHHNNQITTQMSNYDIHDNAHSERVIEIIENLLGDKIDNLSCYELIMIYMSAYLHDSGMALPLWEYDVLRSAEGTDSIYDNTLEFKICNDLKPVHRFSDALNIVKENKKLLFDFNKAKDYVFAEESEETMTMSLAALVCEYEEFRNGYVEQLRSASSNTAKYLNLSKLIRSEFIRQTHHIRVVKNINSLKGSISKIIGAFHAEKFICDLGNICRCHGEDIGSVFELECCREDWTKNKSNIQFVAMLLRLGDVIHFSSDRAPLSLFAEKRIEDETSFMHWKAKFQELTFSFEIERGYTVVKYKAFCSGPEVYYFIQDYLNWVDSEIYNYYILKQRWEQKSIENIDNYILPISDKVDREDIDYDKDVFIPKKEMRFTLNQSKILELLMGKQLYKDEFLCLRELYQNALDATKCMIAYNSAQGVTETYKIEFGIGEDSFGEVKRRYIYCLDHGTGMNEYIINNFLLHIGNSYYRSGDFSKKNTAWGFEVNPTSQFGIGILSGYMIADKIGVTSVYYENGAAESFILEGINDHFYHINPSKLDIESIGKHGTMIKLYLKNEFSEKINSKYIGKLPAVLMSENDDVLEQIYREKDIKSNLSYILSKYIGIFNQNIPVSVKHDDNISRELPRADDIFDMDDYDEIDEHDVELLWEEYSFMEAISSHKEALEKRGLIEDYIIKASGDNVDMYSHISLPKKGFDGDNIKVFDYCRFIGKHEGSVWVDGIMTEMRVDFSDPLQEIFGFETYEKSLFNFIGNIRPTLSVDRNTCVDMPQLDEEYKQIFENYVRSVTAIICEHTKKHGIGMSDPEFELILNILGTFYSPIAGKVYNALCDTEFGSAKFPDSALMAKEYTLESFLRSRGFEIEKTNFTEYKEITRQIILGKCIGADSISICDDKLSVSGEKFFEYGFSRFSYLPDDPSLSTILLRADSWEGKYKEYDLVNTLWPIVNPTLYDKFCDFYAKDVNAKCKTIREASNTIQGIATLNPTMINPRIGISTFFGSSFDKRRCLVGEYDRIEHNYWLFELEGYTDDPEASKTSPALFAYIAPRTLNEIETERLAEFEESDPTYVQGVKEGWSILFLGKTGKYVICPGVVSREHICSIIPQSFKHMAENVEFFATDGTKLL